MKKIAAFIKDIEDAKLNYNFFDINCWMPFNEPNLFLSINTMEEYLSILRSSGIKKLVISNKNSISSNPILGNDEIIKIASNYKDLYVGAILVPEIEFSKGNMNTYIDKLVKEKVVLIRMFPKKLNYSLKKWQIGNTLEYLQYKHLPLMLWHTETTWDTINEICEAYPKLPVIIDGNEKKLLYHNRSYIALLKKHKNIYIETHNFVQYLGYEYIVGKMGIDRFLFGSNFPDNSPDSSVLPIITASINEISRLNIISENFFNLVKDIRIN
jgi:predicted TIM-barrel fold metal-dependent hydrolase